MKELKIKVCTDAELDLLATMNRQLIEDEGHNNPMNQEQLRERMYGFIHADYKAYLFMKDAQTLGYALVDHTKKPLYLRQFFICREVRRQGYGKILFQGLLEQLHTEVLDIEVLTGNERGIAFWKALGFQERSVYMRFQQE